jgi:hypothetical protein
MKIFKKFPQPARQYIRDLSLIIIGFMLNYIPELLGKLPGLLGKLFTGFNQFIKTKVSMEISIIVLLCIFRLKRSRCPGKQIHMSIKTDPGLRKRDPLPETWDCVKVMVT